MTNSSQACCRRAGGKVSQESFREEDEVNDYWEENSGPEVSDSAGEDAPEDSGGEAQENHFCYGIKMVVEGGRDS